jgi:uncharacterized protein YbaP (TraB family)
MKALVAGIVLIILSGSILLWRRSAEAPRNAAAGPERSTRCMVWKARRGAATVWLCGSIHLLRENDYPLPEPYLKAFEEAKTVVMELPPGSAEDPEVQKKIQRAGTLPEGESLQRSVSAATWNALENWSRQSGTSIEMLQRMKPWFAAITIPVVTLQRSGFSVSRGMERWFAARLGHRKAEGLESAEQQLGLFDTLDPKTREEMILQAVEEAANAPARASQLAEAWREGDATRLGAVMQQSLGQFPDVKKVLLDDRHAAWIPAIESHLAGAETVMVLVGSAHLAGNGSLVDLLEDRGVSLTQMEYRTTRPAPGTSAGFPP